MTNSNKVPVKIVPETERISELKIFHENEFGSSPSYFVRVPGRVNIIGEHVDYCGYPVLPMALEQDILIAVGLTEDPELRLRNTNTKYQPFNCRLVKDIEIKPDSNGKPFWYNYVLCGIKGAMEFLNSDIFCGLQMFIDGNVPPASGLSSSSALVSAACLSCLHANNAEFSKYDIAALCARCEQYIGTQGGGMDQAIAFLTEKHSAQYITWNPLKTTPITLPEDALFVVAHSIAEANKAATNDFNRRVIECRLAAKLIATLFGYDSKDEVLTLSHVQKILGKSLSHMVELVYKHLDREIYTKNDICDLLAISEAALDKTYLTNNTKGLNEFKLKQRALHVYQEAMRVEEFKRICIEDNNKKELKNGVANLKNSDCFGDMLRVDILGKLMSKSHESLKTLYECSHENLDKLVDLSKEFGVHARLTGAGWGGCVVALCPKNDVYEYISFIKKNFYNKHLNIDIENAGKYIFATIPNQGAEIYSYSC